MSEFDVEEGAFGTNTKEPTGRVFGCMDGGDKLGMTSALAKKNAINKGKTQVVERKTMLILILDEIDQFATRDNSVLYRIFERHTLPGSPCFSLESQTRST
ncbi:hypothetical protein BC830DRAFT_941014 [Chytriomyces sp. MP71]|nr:hypothetical protein BC830DRAFT_941014 [Chytriomyces sp. MP71]